ncbi:MAG: DUF481 domain-containing protein [Planctomycetota bacterium]|nr:DUF481 domain-containing protein [Planctomycetota bacterium]
MAGVGGALRAWRAGVVIGACAGSLAGLGHARGASLAVSQPASAQATSLSAASLSALSLRAGEAELNLNQPEPAPPGEAAPADAGAPAGGEAPAPEIVAEKGFFEGWKGNIEGGLNGSDGNSENLSFRFGVGANRKVETMETVANFTYAYATDDGEKSKNRAEFFGKNDWLFKDSPWGFFAQAKLEYDDFQDWDWRLSLYAGPTYTVIKNERTTFRLKAGAGATKEFGSTRNEWIPEGIVGFDLTHKLTDRQSVYVSAEYLPSLSDFPDYRINAKAGWEILVDPEVNMTLKLGIEDRYNSNPGPGFRKNDVDYFIILAWTF